MNLAEVKKWVETKLEAGSEEVEWHEWVAEAATKTRVPAAKAVEFNYDDFTTKAWLVVAWCGRCGWSCWRSR